MLDSSFPLPPSNSKYNSWRKPRFPRMRSVTLIIPHIFVVQAHVKEFSAEPTTDLQDATDKLADKLVDRVITSPPYNADLDSTTLGKTQLDKSFGVSFSRGTQQVLPRQSAPVLSAPHSILPSFVYNHGHRRHISSKANSEIASEGSIIDDNTKEKLLKVLDQYQPQVHRVRATGGNIGHAYHSSALEIKQKLAAKATDESNRGDGWDMPSKTQSDFASQWSTVDDATKEKLGNVLDLYRPQFRKRVEALQSSFVQPSDPSPLENLAITAVDANTRDDWRDISLLEKAWSTVDDKTKEKFSKTLDQVKAKERAFEHYNVGLLHAILDPIGFSSTVTGGRLLFYREVELKHGRVAMLSSLGLLVGEQFRWLVGSDINMPFSFDFQHTSLQNFWPAVVTAIAIPEILSALTFQNPLTGEKWAMKDNHVPGDIGWDPLGLKPTDPQEFKVMQTKELKNGRLAMVAAAGMVAQELAAGQKLF